MSLEMQPFHDFLFVFHNYGHIFIVCDINRQAYVLCIYVENRDGAVHPSVCHSPVCIERLYVGKDTRYGHSYYGKATGNHMHSIES